jgi:uncharacterized membrane protein YhiD involved in acid resistance
MGIEEIIKKSVLELERFSNFSVINILIGLTLTFAITLVIFYIYKLTFTGVIYSQSYGITLILLSLVTSMIIMTISSNVILSLGMVGALSIVRFRTAIKDPRDVAFMFWAIAVGISCGAGMFVTAIISTLFIGIVVTIMTKTKYVHTSYLLIINYHVEAYTEMALVLDELRYSLKSKMVNDCQVELVLELKKIKDNTAFVEHLSAIEGVKSAVVVKYNGDYAE